LHLRACSRDQRNGMDRLAQQARRVIDQIRTS
jgi:hypothetical protein